jgi:hypothetical protein
LHLLCMYLLSTNVNVDVDKLPIEHLLIIVLSILVFLLIIFRNGFSFKLGEKEINIGGVSRLLAKRDNDTLRKEELKKYSDDVDHEVTANLYDLVEELEDNLEAPLTQGDHCYFTYEKYLSIVKSELYKRIRRNSLWEKLSDVGKERYINATLKDIERRYDQLQAKANLVKCADAYVNFSVIKGDIRNVLVQFFDRTADILIAGFEKKCEKYEKTKPEFKTAEARKICCDDCIDKNKERIIKLNKSRGRAL